MISPNGTIVVGKKGKSGRKKVKEEIIREAKKRVYREVLEEILPDKLLAEKHLELLTVPRKCRTYIKGDLQTEVEELDSVAVSKGLDMAYKIKGEYAPEKREISGEISVKEITGMKIISEEQHGNSIQNKDSATSGSSEILD